MSLDIHFIRSQLMLLAVELNKVDIVSEVLGRTNEVRTQKPKTVTDDSTSNRVVRALYCLITAVSSVFSPATSETTISGNSSANKHHTFATALYVTIYKSGLVIERFLSKFKFVSGKFNC